MPRITLHVLPKVDRAVAISHKSTYLGMIRTGEPEPVIECVVGLRALPHVTFHNGVG
jgi:hypothetical protein